MVIDHIVVDCLNFEKTFITVISIKGTKHTYKANEPAREREREMKRKREREILKQTTIN